MRHYGAKKPTKAAAYASYRLELARMTDAALEACEPASLARVYGVTVQTAAHDLLHQKLLRSINAA